MFATYFAGAPPHAESPTRRARTQAPRAQAATASCSRVVLAEGTGKQRQRPRPAQPPRLRRDARGPRASCARRWREHLPQIRSRRRAPAPARAPIDLRRTLRAATRTGEITTLARRDRPHRTRPLLLLIDVSGSLRAHTPGLPALRVGRAGRDVHVRHAADADHARSCATRDVDAALANVSETRRGRRRRHAHRARAAGVPRHAALRRPRPRRADDRALRRPRARRPGADGRTPSHRLVAALAPAAVVDAAGRSTPPTARSPARWPRSSDDLDGLAGARDLPTLLEQVQAAVSYVDAHHHIWPAQDLPWLDGPMIPRIFGPYESLQGKAYTAEEYARRRDRRTASASRSTCRPTGRWRTRSTRSSGSTSSTSAPAGRTRSSAPRTCSTPHAVETLEAQAEAIAADARHAACSCTGTSTRRSASPAAPDRVLGPGRSTRTSRGSPSSAASSSCRSSRTSSRTRRELVADHPDLTFVLIHAGMPIEGEPWREALAELAQHPERQRQALRPGHVHPPRRPGADQDVTQGRARHVRLRPRDVRLQLPGRKHVDRLL